MRADGSAEQVGEHVSPREEIARLTAVGKLLSPSGEESGEEAGDNRGERLTDSEVSDDRGDDDSNDGASAEVQVKILLAEEVKKRAHNCCILSK